MVDKYTLVPDLQEWMAEIPPDSIISRTFFQDASLRAIVFGFAAGQELSEHTAAKPAVLHFISGEGELTLGEDQHEVRPGAWVHMPAHLVHRVQARTKLVMLLLLFEA